MEPFRAGNKADIQIVETHIQVIVKTYGFKSTPAKDSRLAWNDCIFTRSPNLVEKL